MNVQTVNIDAAVEGMVLARDLCDGSGVLLPQGATLTEIALRSLRRRGIEACEVVVDEAAPDAAALAAERGAASGSPTCSATAPRSRPRRN